MSTTLTKYLSDQAQNPSRASVANIVAAVANACRAVSTVLRTAELDGLAGSAGSTNVQGEVQKPLDLKANEAFLAALRPLPQVSCAVSEEDADPIILTRGGSFAVLFDPLDGSSNLDVNVTVGSIFSIIAAKEHADLLQPGSRQLAAGYAAYGPATTLVLTFGETVEMFVLSDGEFRLSRAEIRIAPSTAEFAINTSRERLWDPGIRQYVADCVAGKAGPLGKTYNMRWVGSMVAEVQRILARGGVFLYPADRETKATGGRLRLLYEVAPMAMIVETADGLASTGDVPVSSLQPDHIHQRVPAILGSREEVAKVVGYTKGGR